MKQMLIELGQVLLCAIGLGAILSILGVVDLTVSYRIF
jgi:hypothetical protein